MKYGLVSEAYAPCAKITGAHVPCAKKGGSGRDAEFASRVPCDDILTIAWNNEVFLHFIYWVSTLSCIPEAMCTDAYFSKQASVPSKIYLVGPRSPQINCIAHRELKR